MTTITDNLERIRRWRTGCVDIAELQPGLDPERVVERISEHTGHHPPASLVDLYVWRDGIDYGAPDRANQLVSKTSLVFGVLFYGLDFACSQYLSFDAEYGSTAVEKGKVPEAYVEASWFPVFRDVHEGVLAVDCAPGKTFGAVLVLFRQGPPYLGWPSLDDLVHEWALMIDRGGYFVDPQTGLQSVDDEIYNSLSRPRGGALA
jgi:hypothetical protein